MFNIKKWLMTVVIALLMVVQTGCTQNNEAQPAEAAKPPSAEPVPNEPVELEFWSYYGGWEKQIAAFGEKYPGVTIQVKTFPFSSYAAAYLQAVADGVGPDIMMADSEHFGQFTAIAGMEDLLAYGAGKYRQDFSESLWQSGLSFDDKKLMGFPVGTSPLLTYYRADLMEQYGFPSDPEQLGAFMEKPEHWLEIGKALKKDNRYITQWHIEPVYIFERSHALFDSQLRFARNTDTFVQAIEIAKEVNSAGLQASIDVWTPAGAVAVQEGKIAMMYMGAWGADQIKEWAPESAGLWRETRLPFNQYGWVNSSNFMMPSAGKHKEWAWKFIEFCVTEWSLQGQDNGVPAYIPARGNPKKLERTSPYFGEQKLYALHERLAENMREFKSTPLDGKAQAIWGDEVNTGIERLSNSKHILEQIKLKIDADLGKEVAILKNALNVEP
ncbi:multiple sugar transport system substrate-binding protein [Paenibacillus sp. UNCCL117]|uniref:ABC transporter substrate-binding protein n=1 Tax=unclassified Paenibacillus TaxID=185978 RepID=UPI0008812212|nr:MULTISPECIES: extracellular solute-binding protein [unclassified Paenibacillus]SDD49966.1 carbohydrate ABC transporter substrate-binding protein, CUT1 family [Paenibacillus sp. cl123]SFW49825.1 multiple sugar transport system substrate-binding protein [Paenibacillus sp. UNCCL117]